MWLFGQFNFTDRQNLDISPGFEYAEDARKSCKCKKGEKIKFLE